MWDPVKYKVCDAALPAVAAQPDCTACWLNTAPSFLCIDHSDHTAVWNAGAMFHQLLLQAC